MRVRERSEQVLADLIRIRAEANPDFGVLTFEHQSLEGEAGPDEVRSYAELWSNASRIAARLARLGIREGDRFAIMMRNHPEFVEAAIAASILGAVFVPIDPRTRGSKLAYLLCDAACSGLVCADDCLPAFDLVREGVPELDWILGIESTAEAPPLRDFKGVEDLAETLAGPFAELDVRAEPTTPLEIMYTSGTTGDPKGIVGSNARFCGAGLLGRLFGYLPEDRPYTGLSLTHGNAQSVSLVPALAMGLRGVISRRFTKSKLWEVCRRYGCTTFSLVGGMATGLYSEPPLPEDAKNPVRLVVSGGMPRAIWEAFEKRFDVRILEFYGAMDGGGMAYKPVGQGPVGSFGKPMPGIEMKILDAQGKDCPSEEVGEICTRPVGRASAPPVEYFGDPEAGQRKVREGWNHSGDMGHSDPDGWLFFDYRAGGGIRHNGDFVNPSFVEKAIAEHPSIRDVFVYGAPAASGAPGERDVVAAIVLAKGAELDLRAIFARCREQLEANFVPSYVQVLDEIPRTASEKPQERLLIASFEVGGPRIYREPH